MKTKKYIVQELKDPNMGSPEFQAMYRKFANRILWIDDNVVEGAFQMNTAWYFDVPELDPVFEEHVHNYDELIGFFGSNPEMPYELGAVMDVTIEGEVHRVSRSTMIFIPAGVPHMPLSIKSVDRPVFHFSVVMSPEYSGDGAYR
jgi:hypothetical protein